MTLGHAPSLRTFVAVLTASAVLAGCAGRSLRQAPPVVDWSSGGSPPVSQVTPSPSDAAVTYTVRRDDTLASIAARFNTTPTNLAAWNNLGANPRLRTGDVLRVAPPGAQATVDSNPVATTQPIGNDVVEQRAIGTAMPPLQQ
jgi:lipoprotein NlpD